MNPGALLSLMAVALVAPSTPPDAAALANASRSVLQHCGTTGTPFLSAPDEDWTPSASAEAKHAALRRALGEPWTPSRTWVAIHAIGGDLETTEFSVVLARGRDGIWRGTAVGQSRIWIRDAKPSVSPRRAWDLAKENGRRLDALLADKCLYAEPTSFHSKSVPPVGALWYQVDMQTPLHQRHATYRSGLVEGLTKEIIDLAFPPHAP